MNRRMLLTAVATALALCGCAHGDARPDPEQGAGGPPPSAEGLARLRDLMYADMDLDGLLLGTEGSGPIERAAAALRAGQVENAAKVMTPTAVQAGGAEARLMVALIRQRRGDPAGAESALRSVARDAKAESRMRLTAARALRKTGKAVDEDVADELLGVVVETLSSEVGVDSLSIYRERSARYANEKAGVILYEPTDGRLDEVIAAMERPNRAAYLKAPLAETGRGRRWRRGSSGSPSSPCAARGVRGRRGRRSASANSTRCTRASRRCSGPCRWWRTARPPRRSAEGRLGRRRPAGEDGWGRAERGSMRDD
jgi:hypothetical protein